MMTTLKTIASASWLVACLILGATTGCGAASKDSAAQKAKPAAQAASSTIPADTAKKQAVEKVIVYYFLGTARCPTCFKLEQYAKEAVEVTFADAIKAGRMEWKTLNVEQPGNEHFKKDYKLYTKSVIVSRQQDGKEVAWKNLDRIWQIVGNEAKYKEYIISEVRACLKGKCL